MNQPTTDKPIEKTAITDEPEFSCDERKFASLNVIFMWLFLTEVGSLKDVTQLIFAFMVKKNQPLIPDVGSLFARYSRIRQEQTQIIEEINNIISNLKILQGIKFNMKSFEGSYSITFDTNDIKIKEYFLLIQQLLTRSQPKMSDIDKITLIVPPNMIDSLKSYLRVLTLEYFKIPVLLGVINISNGSLLRPEEMLFALSKQPSFCDVVFKVRDLKINGFDEITKYLRHTLNISPDNLAHFYYGHRKFIIEVVSQHFCVGEKGLKFEHFNPIMIISDAIAAMAFEILEELYLNICEKNYPKETFYSNVFFMVPPPTTKEKHITLLRDCYLSILSHIFNTQNAECKEFYYSTAKRSLLMKHDPNIGDLLKKYEEDKPTANPCVIS